MLLGLLLLKCISENREEKRNKSAGRELNLKSGREKEIDREKMK